MKVQNILFSQNPPGNLEKTPYAQLSKKHGVNIDFHKFFQVEGVDIEQFKKNKIDISEYSAVVFTSKNAVNHLYGILKELNIGFSVEVKFFCINQSVAFYLKNFVTYRKRKIYYGNGKAEDLVRMIERNRDRKFLLPCSVDTSVNPLLSLLDEKEIDYKKAEVFQIKMADLRHIDINAYEMIVFFSPFGIQSLQANFPKYKQNETVIGALGYQVLEAAKEAGIKVTLTAPTKEHPSIFTAIDEYLQLSNSSKKQK